MKAYVNPNTISLVYNKARALLELAYPPVCSLCLARGDSGYDLCRGCRDDLPQLERCCERCGLALESRAQHCGGCLRKPPPFDLTVAALSYRAPVDRFVHELKFQGKLVRARLLGALLADAVANRATPLPELLIPVPLHPRRLRQRGFNQAAELGRVLAHRLGLPLDHRILSRTRETPPQHELPAAARRSNVRGAFRLRRSLEVRHVALIDDVMTTGSTVREAARVLKKSGAERVEVWVTARA